MRTIVLTYPGYQSLPKGIKQMLVASENFYFDEIKSAPAKADADRVINERIVTFSGWGIPWKAYAGV